MSILKKLWSWLWGDGEPTQPIEESSTEKITLAAYNVLRNNVTESAKHARNLFIGHVGVNVYAIVTVATLKDADFFVDNASIKLPVVDLEVSPSLYLPGVALISVFIYLYFQFYIHNMWTLVAKVKSYSSQHIEAEGYVPDERIFRYPWIAFATNAESRWYRLIANVFTLFQWFLTPFLILVCWIRTDRLGGRLEHWLVGLPWPYFFSGLLFVLLLTFPFWYARYRRIIGSPLKLRGKMYSLITACCYCVIAALLNNTSLGHPLQLAYTEMRATGYGLPIADLHRANLKGANLGRAYFVKANLRRSDLREANLFKAKLCGTNLENAHLSGSNLYGADLSGANLENAHLGGAILEGANLENAHLENSNLSGATLERAFLTGANLERANHERANLENAFLREANLERVNLYGAYVEKARYDSSTKFSDDSNYRNRGMIGPGTFLKGANLKGTNLNREDLFRANLGLTNLEGAFLGGTDLREANLKGANLKGANLREANLLKADLRDANLFKAKLEGADLKGADLKGADLKGADLKGANLEGAKLGGAVYDDRTRFPVDFDPKAQGVVKASDIENAGNENADEDKEDEAMVEPSSWVHP